MSLLYLCEYQNSMGDKCLCGYFRRAGKACSLLESVFYRQTIQPVHIKQPQLCCIKALTVYSFRLLNDTWLSQACAKSEPPGRCFWGNKCPQQRHSCVQHSALLCLLPESHAGLGELREPDCDLLCVSAGKVHVPLHSGACEPLLCLGQSCLSSGKEIHKPYKGTGDAPAICAAWLVAAQFKGLRCNLGGAQKVRN